MGTVLIPVWLESMDYGVCSSVYVESTTLLVLLSGQDYVSIVTVR